jgi:hypothetical protein
MSNNRSAVSTRDGSIVVHIPMQFKKKAGRRQVVITEPMTINTPAKRSALPESINKRAQEAVVIALARAHKWKELLETGQFRSITELAKAFRVDGSYVGRILRLTLLAPDIVEALINGKEPEGVSLRKLIGTLPVEWNEQRALILKEQEYEESTRRHNLIFTLKNKS